MKHYLGKKKETDCSLGENVALIPHNLWDAYCTLYFDNFFNSLTLMAKLFDDGIYGIGTVWSNRKMIRKLPDNKSMKWGDIH